MTEFADKEVCLGYTTPELNETRHNMKLFAAEILKVVAELEGEMGQKLGVCPESVELSKREINFYSTHCQASVMVYWNETQKEYDYGVYRTVVAADGKSTEMDFDLSVQQSDRLDVVLNLIYWIYESKRSAELKRLAA